MPASRATDRALLHSWWSGLKADLPDEVRGLWFGIVDFQVDGVTRRTLYVTGSPEFDADDPTAEWAAADYVWWPDARYVDLPGVAALPAQPYVEILRYAAELVRDLNPLPIASVEGAAVGFDDGDFELL